MLSLGIALLCLPGGQALSIHSGHRDIEQAKELPLTDIFLLAGQSNCVGLGKQDQIASDVATPPSNAFVWPRSRNDWETGTWNAFNLPGLFGPEASFFHMIANQIYQPAKESFGVVKVAKINTSVKNDWSLENYENLLANQTMLGQFKMWGNRWERNISDVFTPWLFANLVDSAKKALKSDRCGGKCNVKALLWVQGEADAHEDEYAMEYENSLKLLVDKLRDELGAPDLKVIVAQVSPELDKKGYPGLPLMLQAQQSFVRHEGDKAALVKSNDLEKFSDNLHYNETGLQELGSRMAWAYLKLLGLH